MDVAEFSRALEGLTADDVHRIAATLTSNHSDSAADEVEAWRVTLTIDRVLRRTHRTRLAARAASSITHTVLQIASAQGIRLPEVRRLFPDWQIDARRVALLPPIARAVAPRSWRLASLLGQLPFLRTHWLALLRKS